MEPSPTLQTVPAPQRSPAYRYDTARAAADRGRALHPQDADLKTRELARHLNQELLAATHSEQQALARRHPHVSAALALHREPERGTASLVEALILAREELAPVARRSGVPINVVKVYADFFLSLGADLDAPAYVLDQVIRPELRRGNPAVARRNAALKFVAYFCGAAGLDELFGVGRVRFTELWRPLPDVARRVALARDVEVLVDAALADMTGSGANAAAALAAVIERVTSLASATVPESKVARDGARLAAVLD